MAIRARLSAPREIQQKWPYHKVKSASLPASMLFGSDRRMEAENFLASGFATRQAFLSKSGGWCRFADVAATWQPSRLKGIQVSPDFGTPFLAATQVFDLRPVPRKWLSLDRTEDSSERFVRECTILLTCSGNVGRATLADASIDGMLISHDLLRIKARQEGNWGWIYAYLRSPTVRAMMTSAQYGHMIKHLEIAHLDALPIIRVEDAVARSFTDRAASVVQKRNASVASTHEAERLFEAVAGTFVAPDDGTKGFSVLASQTFDGPRRRLEAYHHNPTVRSLVGHLAQNAIGWASVADLGFRVWLPTRFRRIAAEDGVPFVDSADLFEVNPDITKRIADKDFGDAHNGRVRRGWMLLSRSGQIYGLNGSAIISGQAHEGKVISDHVIRIASDQPKCRVGYLLTAMTHPELGRPRVKSLAYGSSIPEIEVEDIKVLAIPRFGSGIEGQIADQAELAARLRDEADILETQLAEDADEIVTDFLSHKAAGILAIAK
ncbi:hypothetical protein EN873_14900 [bacterium M00.F.Ca.ET.230.01.1.1]|nr:hypothetical protein EN873_14900 [bacterium M00.F.Ca.ET.230.01.1.1]